MFLNYPLIPKTISDYYNIHKLQTNNKIYSQINRGMYGLPQDGLLAHDQLIIILNQHDFTTSPLTPGLWTHHNLKLSFVLYVDDFDIKYTSIEDANFLINILKSHYPITTDWSGSNYCGLSIQWKYTNPKHVGISIPNYITHTLQTFNHVKPTKPQH